MQKSSKTTIIIPFDQIVQRVTGKCKPDKIN